MRSNYCDFLILLGTRRLNIATADSDWDYCGVASPESHALIERTYHALDLTFERTERYSGRYYASDSGFNVRTTNINVVHRLDWMYEQAIKRFSTTELRDLRRKLRGQGNDWRARFYTRIGIAPTSYLEEESHYRYPRRYTVEKRKTAPVPASHGWGQGMIDSIYRGRRAVPGEDIDTATHWRLEHQFRPLAEHAVRKAARIAVLQGAMR